MSSTGSASLLKLLVRSTRAFESQLHDAVRADLGDELRPAHYAVFSFLDQDGSRVSTLAEAAGMTQQSMGELVGHLERHGYVERRRDPRDGRARIVVSTEAGGQAVRVAAGRIAEIEGALAHRVGERRLIELHRLLTEVGRVLADPAFAPGTATTR